MGASVLHEEAVFPVRDAGIPLVIKNTNAPRTRARSSPKPLRKAIPSRIITGIAGKRDFLAINVSRDRTKSRIGFMRRAPVCVRALWRVRRAYAHGRGPVRRRRAGRRRQGFAVLSLISDIQEEVEPPRSRLWRTWRSSPRSAVT